MSASSTPPTGCPYQSRPMRRAAAADSNQPEIVAALRKAGALVHPMHAVGGGFPDLLVCFRGKLLLIEVKDGAKPPSKRKLTPDQVEFHRLWPVTVVKNVDEAIAVILGTHGIVLGVG